MESTSRRVIGRTRGSLEAVGTLNALPSQVVGHFQPMTLLDPSLDLAMYHETMHKASFNITPLPTPEATLSRQAS